jgi:hypothetical protein
MRIFEFINEEVVDEAISMTKYNQDLVDAIKTGIINGVLALEKPIMSNQNLLDVINDDSFSDRYARQYLQREAEASIEKAVIKQLKLTLAKILDKGALSKIRFGKMSGMGGFARGSEIVLNRTLLDGIAKTVINRICTAMYEHPAGQRTRVFEIVFNMLKQNSDKMIGYLLHGLEPHVDNIVSILVHEAVHIIQHKQQAHRGLGKTEYRSYLDKQKGEFRSAAQKAVKTKNRDRYYDLYYASPQEITAFAHQMALDVVNAYGLNKVTDLKDIPKITSENIIEYINKRINNRFAQPRNPQETQVRRRYLKLVYQEVHRYIEHVQQVLGSSAGNK